MVATADRAWGRPATATAAGLDRRLIVVTGKGGVGKTTVAAVLGESVASAGRRAVVCELDGQDVVARAFGRRACEEPVELAPGLWHVAVDPEPALREWLRRQPGGAAAAAVLGRSPAFRTFVAAAPGVKELVTIGKVADLGPPDYDAVIVDAPSTGHAIGMVAAPRSVAEVARAGAVRHDAGELFALLTDPDRTAYVGVTLPEEMPVAEVLDLEHRLLENVGVPLSVIVVNAVQPDRFSDAEAATIADVRRRHPHPALDAALRAHARARSHLRLIARLREHAAAPVIELPFLVDLQGPALYAALTDRLTPLCSEGGSP